MTEPIALPMLPAPVPLNEITTRQSRFYCVPYRIVITADTCVRRQAIVRASGAKEQGDIHRFMNCRNCALGTEVEARSGGAMQVTKHFDSAINGLQRASRKAFADSRGVNLSRPRGPKCVTQGCPRTVWEARVKFVPPGTEGMCGQCRANWVSADRTRARRQAAEAAAPQPAEQPLREPLEAEHKLIRVESPPEVTEEKTMEICKYEGCSTKVYDVGEVPAGTEGLCGKHRRQIVQQATGTDKPKSRKKPGPKPKAVGVKRPRLAPVVAPPSGDLSFAQAAECVELVQRMGGMENARTLAALFDGARS